MVLAAVTLLVGGGSFLIRRYHGGNVTAPVKVEVVYDENADSTEATGIEYRKKRGGKKGKKKKHSGKKRKGRKTTAPDEGYVTRDPLTDTIPTIGK